MRQSMRPKAELPAKASAPSGLIPYAAALLCTILLLCISHPSAHVTSYAAGDDETTWQGTVKIVTSTHQEEDKGETYGPLKKHHVYRHRSDSTVTYTGFRIEPETEEMRAWQGPADVNLTTNESNYHLDTETFPNSYDEDGFESTTTGSTVAQGVVKFYRYRSQDDPRKTRCRIEVDAASDWRDRPELKIWEVGRSWSKILPPPERDPNLGERPVKQQHTLAPTFHGVNFDCDPKAASYSGHQETEAPGSPTSQVITWNLSHHPPNVEAVIVPPDSYEQWLPEAGKDESTPGNRIVITVKLHKRGYPNKPAGTKAKFHLTLSKVSSEKGICLNAPLKKDAKGWPDLKIDTDVKQNPDFDVADDGQSATSKRFVESAKIVITAYDYGAYGQLFASAVLKDGGELTAHVEGGGKYELTIPWDEDSNHIADWWDRVNAGDARDANADADRVPQGDSDDGDGLSLYEEYRGFMQQKGHIRTNPILKDLFIRDEGVLTLGSFEQAGLATHLIALDEYEFESGEVNTRVINFNRGFGTRGPQHLLFLKARPLEGDYGLAQGPEIGPPKETSEVSVDRQKCLAVSPQVLDWVVAHELAHGCNVWHHGDIDYSISRYRDLNPDGSWGAWRQVPKGAQYGISVQGGQESGVEECIMRYNFTSFYEAPKGSVQWQKADGSLRRGERYGPGETPGTIFCNTRTGTGVNLPTQPGGPKGGNASKGECRWQFCVNDHKH